MPDRHGMRCYGLAFSLPASTRPARYASPLPNSSTAAAANPSCCSCGDMPKTLPTNPCQTCQQLPLPLPDGIPPGHGSMSPTGVLLTIFLMTAGINLQQVVGPQAHPACPSRASKCGCGRDTICSAGPGTTGLCEQAHQ